MKGDQVDLQIVGKPIFLMVDDEQMLDQSELKERDLAHIQFISIQDIPLLKAQLLHSLNTPE